MYELDAKKEQKETTHCAMQIYFPTQVPQQAIRTVDFFNGIRVKTLVLELLEELEAPSNGSTWNGPLPRSLVGQYDQL